MYFLKFSWSIPDENVVYLIKMIDKIYTEWLNELLKKTEFCGCLSDT
jgi:hypothetical protein